MASLLAAGDTLSAWSKDEEEVPAGVDTAASAAAGAAARRKLVAQAVAAGVRVSDAGFETE